MDKNRTQSQFLKGCITQALLELMREKPFEEISITELTRKAGTSRMAYYRNYANKEEILLEYLDLSFNDYIGVLNSYADVTFPVLANEFFSFFNKKHKAFVQTLINSNLEYLLLQKFREYLGSIFTLLPKDRKKALDEYQQSFLAGGLYSILVDWITKGADKSEEEMTVLVGALLSV